MKQIKPMIGVFALYLIIIAPFSFGLAISDVQSKTGSNYAVITWKTDEEATSKVDYGKEKDQLTESESSLSLVKNHSLILGNLDKTSKYFFQVMSSGLVDNNLGQYYAFQTKSDTQPPFLEVNIPNYANKDKIDIIGKTELYTKVDLFVNGVKVRKKDPKPEEKFSFSDVLLGVGTNTLKIDATDGDGNVESQAFIVVVDTKEPVVTLAELPSAVTEGSVRIKGTVDENATVTVLVNAEEIFKEATTEFEQDVSLAQGKNLVTIGVRDIAGNEVTLTRTILYDDEPPKIEAVNPGTGSFFYEGNAVTDIKGITEPGARVELYYNKEPDGKPRKTTTADENGRFEFKDFNLEYGFRQEIITGRGRKEIREKPIVSEPGVIEEYVEIPEREYGKPAEVGVRITLVAVDAVGLKAEVRLNYRVGTCFAGELSFDVTNLVEYQGPTLLSPERLEQGTELISFILNLTYRGIGENVDIKDVRIERACEATAMQEDDEYKYSCGIISTTPNVRKSNEDKTLWYVRYDLQGLDVEGFSTDLWEDLTRQMIFPLKVRIEYTDETPYDLPEEMGKRKFMIKCLPIAYTLDTSRIDPRDLPDGLLTGMQGVFNSTLDALNKIIPWVDQVNRLAGLSCFVTFLGKLVVVIMKRFSSYAESFADRPLDISDPSRCPAPGRSPRGVETAETDKKQDDLENEEFEARCPETYGWWQTEAEFDKTMKWACDRFLCRAVPARWTEKVNFDEIRTNVEKASLCGEKVGTQGTILRRLNMDQCGKWVKEERFEGCYEYQGELYIYKKGSVDKEGRAILERVETGIIPKPGAKETITVIQAGPNSQLTVEPERAKDCKKSCTSGVREYRGSGKKVKVRKWKDGGCLPANAVSRLVADNDQIQLNNDEFVDCPRIGGLDTSCYCWDEIKQEGQDSEKEKKEFDYRLNKVRLWDYSRYRYYKDRDLSGCFGQNNWLYQYDPILNPRDLIPAFQCGCTTQVRARLIVLRNMLQGFNNCVEQIKKTGRYDTGVCKEIFTQYICRWASRVVSYMMEGCAPFTGTGADIGIGDNLQAFAGSVFGGAEESAADLLSDYDTPALRDYFGVGEGAIAQKICLGALTGDWGLDFEGFMDAAYETPFHTAVQAFPAERDYLTWDPSNEQSTFEYRVGWMIAAGCDITSYDVRFGCITDSEYSLRDGVACERNPSADGGYNSATGCDCMTAGEIDQSRPGPTSSIIYYGGSVSQGAFEDKSVHITQDSLYRYDHVIIKLNVADPRLREQCFPEGHEDGIFYFPITDVTPRDVLACRFDQSTGQFVCDAGRFFFNQRGSAYFGKVECDRDVDCEDTIYYAGEPLKLDRFEIYNLGPEKCLYWDVKNRRRQIILQGDSELIPESPDERNPSLVFDRDNWVLIPQIDINQFSRIPAVVTAVPASPSSGLRHEANLDRDIIKGSVDVWFIDTDNDRYGDEMIIGDKENKIGEPFSGYDIKYINGAALKFIEPEVPAGDTCTSSKTQIEGKKYPCYKYTLEFEIPTVDRNEENIYDQIWNIHFEIRALPENGTGYCQDATEKDIITSRGTKQTKDIKVRISTKTKEERTRCDRLSGEIGNENNDWCDCDGRLQEGDELQYKGVNDCDGVTKRYCYYHKDVGMNKCEEFPRCFTGPIINSRDCDCNQDGREGDINGNSCANMYCDGERCSKDKPVENRPPEIDERESNIGGKPLRKLKDNTKDYLEISKDSIIEIFASDDNIPSEKIEVYIAVEGESKIKLTYEKDSESFKSGKIFETKSGSTYADIYAAEPGDKNPSVTQRYYVKIPVD